MKKITSNLKKRIPKESRQKKELLTNITKVHKRRYSPSRSRHVSPDGAKTSLSGK